MERKPYAVMLDDDFAVAEMYRVGLELGGFRVELATDADALYRTIAVEVPDILVLDWQLPGLTGADVLEALRRDSRTARLPVFMLSNFDMERDGAVDRIFAAGAIAWLTKASTPPDRLVERLWEVVGR